MKKTKRMSSGFSSESTRSLNSIDREVEARLESSKDASRAPGTGAQYKDQIPGGVGDKNTPADFPPDALADGIAVEMEHTKDPKLAEEIAIDHLTEDPQYYEKLKDAKLSFDEKIEKKLKSKI